MPAQCGANMDGFDYTGPDITYDGTVLDEETCCELCRTTVGCLKWTLKTAAGVHVDQGCHVKSAVGSHNIGEVGVTSGDVAPKDNSPIAMVTQSWGLMFLTILGVAACVYIVGGMLWRYKFTGGRGVEMVPHWRMWASLPGLVASGAGFVVSRFTGGGGSSRGGGSKQETAGIGDGSAPDYGSNSWDGEAQKRSAKEKKKADKEAAKAEKESRARRKSEVAIREQQDKKDKGKISSTRSARKSEPTIKTASSKSAKSAKSAKSSKEEKKKADKKKEKSSKSSKSSKLLEDSKGDSTVALLAAQPVDRHLAEVYDDEEEQVHSSMRRVKVEVTRE